MGKLFECCNLASLINLFLAKPKHYSSFLWIKLKEFSQDYFVKSTNNYPYLQNYGQSNV